MWLVNQLTAGADSIGGWIFLILASAFWIWMFVDSIRREEYFWAVLMVIFSFLTALFYYFFVYRQAAPAGGRGFELPGAKTRKRIKELQAQIHHLDKAHLHSQLGDVYLEQGSLAKAEASYRAAVERDAEAPDTRAHLGQCLLRQGRVKEALALLEPVCAENPKHEYGQTMMALAEAQG
ncbi:MAG: tetratricopeptide repeat protein, partial [Verrucomicrobia bacterium]|nr:tetratricopeptide repeat protein [Verrucomicrobiota bacterium]